MGTRRQFFSTLCKLGTTAVAAPLMLAQGKPWTADHAAKAQSYFFADPQFQSWTVTTNTATGETTYEENPGSPHPVGTVQDGGNGTSLTYDGEAWERSPYGTRGQWRWHPDPECPKMKAIRARREASDG